MLTRTSPQSRRRRGPRLAACADHKATGPTGDADPVFGTGLPANPSTREYTFNLIGGLEREGAGPDRRQRKRLFVNLYGRSTIKLQEGAFDILDANATDNDGGLFQLPHPDPEDDGVTAYGAWVRTLGRPPGCPLHELRDWRS